MISASYLKGTYDRFEPKELAGFGKISVKQVIQITNAAPIPERARNGTKASGES